MLQFIIDNSGTIIISAVVLLLITLAIRRIVKDKKKSQGACGCGCGDCPHTHDCHS